MLISYNQNYEKIAMGLLSYIADLKNVERLQKEMESYISEEDKRLFLWRDTETDNIIAIIGIEWAESIVLVRHISVNPSFRNEGIMHKMLDKLKTRFPDQTINGTLETVPIITKWVQKNAETSSELDDEE
ncbi:GNAT family N-acetyltransferase [Jeotgalibaca ciconiae]|uniref:N-acetyltransferase n=1 Tax=Jeotgalibaca ciconiae TaxID=2496265 RepID=A0A3Q9BLM3_9LACT|nr:GNAT family N-acetyltransferase [Jeotgalibaca ciconiae]AZP05297.1 N-acetyltransferase [Jeotgalibaca ciconiae]HJB24542.1 N-acetyltransferase [Candidatus Jeotgalibaca pullicola]